MTLKLYYWKMQGRAQMIRVLLKYLQIEYEDIHPTTEEWPELLKTFEEGGFHFPNLPLLVDGDFKLTESDAILSYIADKYGDASLQGKTVEDRAVVNQLLGVIEDVQDIIALATFQPDYKAALEKTLDPAGKLLPKVAALAAFLGEKEYLIGYLTIADIWFGTLGVMWNSIFTTAGLENPFKGKVFFEHTKRVIQLPGVKEYYQTPEVIEYPICTKTWMKNHHFLPVEN